MIKVVCEFERKSWWCDVLTKLHHAVTLSYYVNVWRHTVNVEIIGVVGPTITHYAYSRGPCWELMFVQETCQERWQQGCMWSGQVVSVPHPHYFPFFWNFAGFGRKDVVEHLLQTGANVHARDDGGLIPLHNACSFGHAEVVSLLLCQGADPNARDNWNYTPLHEAAIKGKIDVCIGKLWPYSYVFQMFTTQHGRLMLM